MFFASRILGRDTRANQLKYKRWRILGVSFSAVSKPTVCMISMTCMFCGIFEIYTSSAVLRRSSFTVPQTLALAIFPNSIDVAKYLDSCWHFWTYVLHRFKQFQNLLWQISTNSAEGAILLLQSRLSCVDIIFCRLGCIPSLSFSTALRSGAFLWAFF